MCGCKNPNIVSEQTPLYTDREGFSLPQQTGTRYAYICTNCGKVQTKTVGTGT